MAGRPDARKRRPQMACTQEACELADFVTSVKGLASGSMSPTEVWLLTFDDSFCGADSAFLKLFISPDSVKTDATKALRYEALVYRNVINWLSDFCPNFVEFVAKTQGCSFGHVLALLEAGGFSRAKAEKALLHNLAYIAAGAKGRPSLTDVLGGKAKAKADLWPSEEKQAEMRDEFRYDLIVTKNHNVAGSLAEFLERGDVFPKHEGLGIVFQVAVACYALELLGCVHGDLHLGNILLERLEGAVVEYVVEGTRAVLQSSWRVRIFDFDRASVSWFKTKNPQATKHKGKWLKTPQRAVRNTDLGMFLCALLGFDEHETFYKPLLPALKAVFGKKILDIQDEKNCNALTQNSAALLRETLGAEYIPRLAKQLRATPASKAEITETYEFGARSFQRQ